MKKITSLFLVLLLFTSLLSIQKTYAQAKPELKGNISISGAFALYPLTVKWAEEFKKIHPGVKFDISAGGAGKGMTDALSKMVDIGLVSRAINPEEVKKGAYAIAVTKDAVVPTVSAKNPVIKDILANGLDREAAVNIFITGKTKTWGQALGIKSAVPIRIYTRSDACGAGETWAQYLGKKQEDLLGVGVFGDPGLAQAVTKDPSGIAYNNIGYAYDAKTKKLNPGIKVIPLDVNNNGKIDPDENFYDTLDNLVNAIASGKYPSPPARDLYFVTSGKPLKKELVEFIKWTLTDGQKYVFESGYINLPKEKLAAGLEKVK
ncbi:MAG TPA: substrate-binding domain-containing protein [Prolixibacteraceae bacterium]|nr:substrate-binding domain-containing protein [Prolixibacteraceae bacterium]